MGFNFQPPFSARQQKAIALVPKFFAFPSIVGSIFIVQHVLRNQKRRQGVYHRILLLMSVHDFIYSVKAFVSTWPIPKNTPFVYGASGNTATCTAAGFWGQGGALTSICYNGSLTLYFLLLVRYGWKEEYIKNKIEFWLHVIPIAVGWSTAIAGIPLLLYNAFGWTCWINTFPFGCIDGVTCERGDNAGIYRWAFFHAELWACFGFCFFAMGSVYHRILQQEQRMKRYDFSRSQYFQESVIVGSSFRNKNTRLLSKTKSTKFALQATFYVVAFFFTWCFPMLQAIFSLSSGTLYYPLIMLSAIFSSLQGFSNALIYLRPRFLRIRENNPDERLCVIIALVLGNEDSGVRRRSGPSSSNDNVAAWRQSTNGSNLATPSNEQSDPLSTEQSAPLSNEQSGHLELEKKKMVHFNTDNKPQEDEDENVEEDQYME